MISDLKTLSVVVGFGLDLILGDPRWVPHPVLAMGKFIETYEKAARQVMARLRLHSNPVMELIAGTLLVILTVGGSYWITWWALHRAYIANSIVGFIVEALAIYTTLALKSLATHVRPVIGHLKVGDLPGARQAVSMIVGRDTESMDRSDVLRATIETTAESACDGVIAPMMYAFLGGAPLAMAYKAVNTLDSMVGYKDDRYWHFGWASAMLDDAANFLPARLTAILLLIARLFVRCPGKIGWKSRPRGRPGDRPSGQRVDAGGRSLHCNWFEAMINDAKRHPSPNSGFPESAMAWILGVRLGGLNYYGGTPEFRAHMGPGGPPDRIEQAETALRMVFAAAFIGLIAGVVAVRVSGCGLY